MLKIKEGSIYDRMSHVLFYNDITPQTTTGLSPAELLQNRHLRSRLDLVRPDLEALCIEKAVCSTVALHSRSRSFSVSDPIYMHNCGNGPRWIPGTIRLSVGEDLTLEDGRSFRRHIDHIRERTDLPIRSDGESQEVGAPNLATDTRIEPSSSDTPIGPSSSDTRHDP